MASQLPVRELLCTLKASTRRSLPFKRPCLSSASKRRHQPRNDRRTTATFTHPHHASAISVLSTNVDKSSSEYKSNAKEMDELLARMSELHARIAEGGPQKAKEKHIARGKMLAREYVDDLQHTAFEPIMVRKKHWLIVGMLYGVTVV